MSTYIHTYNTYMYIIIHIHVIFFIRLSYTTSIYPSIYLSICLSIPSGHLIPNPSPPQTICDALLTSIKELPWSIISELVDGIVTVSDDEVITAMKWIMERMKVNYYIIIKYSLLDSFFVYDIPYKSTLIVY